MEIEVNSIPVQPQIAATSICLGVTPESSPIGGFASIVREWLWTSAVNRIFSAHTDFNFI